MSPENSTMREKLWAKATAESWNISTRVLLIVGVKGSFFDEHNPRLPLLRKLEQVIEDEVLRAIEENSRKVKNANELKILGEEYNQRYLSLFLERFKPSELRALSISTTGVVNPSRELEESVHS